MKSFNMLRLAILSALGATALFLAPASKAQEVSSDHFTDTGVQGVYENASAKPATPKSTKAVQTQTSSRSNTATIKEAAERTPIASAQNGSKTASKRKPAKSGSKKQ